MADLKISQLTSNPGIDGTEEMPTAKAGSNFKNTLTALKTWILSAFDLQAVTDIGATTDNTILGDAGGATNYSLSPSGLAINIVAGGSTQYFSNQALLGNAAGASSSILNDGTASFTDGGGNTVSIAPVAGIRVMNGAVGTPSHSFTSQTDMGIYKISATQLGFSVSGILQGGFNAGGFFTGTVSEQTVGNGVEIVGTAGNLILMQNIVGQAYILIPDSTADSAQINFGATGIDPTVPNPGDMWFDSGDFGFSFQGDAGKNHVTLYADDGWAIHTGTGSKAAFDADWTQTISVVVAQGEVQSIVAQLEAVQKTLAGIQDHLMTNMDLFQA